MKKVFIGCGVVVLLGLIALGYVAYKIAPNVTHLHREWTTAIEDLNALDAQYPFDPKLQTGLDPARFALMLDVRVALADYFTGFNAQMNAMQEAQEGEDGPGWIGTLQQIVDQIAPMLTEFATRLKGASMGPQEFAWHTRVLWAVLARVDENLASKELEGLRERYKDFDVRYEELRRKQQGLLPLKDLLSGLPPEALKTAEQVLLQDLPRVHRALSVTDVDHLYMQPLMRVEDLERVEALPSPDSEARAPAEAPANAPDEAPAAPVVPPPAEPAPR